MELPARCVDLSPEQVSAAIPSMAGMRRLLRHMAFVATPGEGAPKILVPIARLASSECDWIDHGLTVEITRAGPAVQIMVASDLGGGVRELLFPRLSLAVDLDEFARAIATAPQLVFPMNARMQMDRITLTCAVDVVGTIAPPPFEIAEESLRRSLAPKLRRSLAPISATETDTKRWEPVIVQGAGVLARIIPVAPRAPKFDEIASLDVGWDLTGEYSSGIGTRQTKPPPEARTLSSAPTLAPPTREKMPVIRAARAKKAPPSRAPAAKPAPRPSKAPSRPTTRTKTQPIEATPRSKTQRLEPQPARSKRPPPKSKKPPAPSRAKPAIKKKAAVSPPPAPRPNEDDDDHDGEPSPAPRPARPELRRRSRRPQPERG